MACDTCGTKLSDAQIARYASFLDSDPEWQTIMTAVAIAESGGCTSCYNGTCCTGLWQVHATHAGKLGSPSDRAAFIAWLRNPDNNTRMATHIYNTQGPKAWEAFTNQSYRQYIERARKVTGVSGPSAIDIATAGIEATTDVGAGFNPLGSITDALNQLMAVVSKAAAWIGDPHNWVRVVEVVGGLALGVVAVGIAVGNNRFPVRSM